MTMIDRIRAAACPEGGAHEWHLGHMQQGGSTPARCVKCGLDRLIQADPMRFMPGHPSRRGKRATT